MDFTGASGGTEPAPRHASRGRVLARAALIALAAALPFELLAPIARVGPLQLSSVEIVLYVALALWAASRLAALVRAPHARMSMRVRIRDRWRALPAIHRAVVAWASVVIVSAVLAPVARPAAIKFALRSLGGMALFVAAADLLDGDARAVARTAAGLGAGVLIAASMMIAETAAPGFAARLRPFHEQTFQQFGLLRSSGPFQYPNIAAMFLEAALPVLLVTGLASADRRRRALALLIVVVALCALPLAGSRAGLVAAFAALLVVAVGARADRRVRRLTLAALAVTVIASALSQAASPLLMLRFRFWSDKAWYRSTIEPATIAPATIAPATPRPDHFAAGAEVVVPLAIRNDGAITWPRTGTQPVHVAYHWDDQATGVAVVFEGQRTMLPRDVPPGGRVQVSAAVRVPSVPGRYILRWDLVHEQVTWFGDRGDRGYRQPVQVEAAATTHAGGWRGRPLAADPAPPSAVVALADTSRRDLWRAAIAAWRQHPLFGLGPDNFRRSYGRYLGLAASDERLHANSLYFETLACLGAAGVLALAALGVALARATRRGASARDTPSRLLALGLGAGLGAYAMHGVVDYFLEFTPTYGLFWLLAGMLAALGRQTYKEGPELPLSGSGRPS